MIDLVFAGFRRQWHLIAHYPIEFAILFAALGYLAYFLKQQEQNDLVQREKDYAELKQIALKLDQLPVEQEEGN